MTQTFSDQVLLKNFSFQNIYLVLRFWTRPQTCFYRHRLVQQQFIIDILHGFCSPSKIMPFIIYFLEMINVSVFMHAILVYPSFNKSVLGLYFASKFFGTTFNFLLAPKNVCLSNKANCCNNLLEAVKY